MRDLLAAAIPSAVMLGLAMHELIQAMFVLIKQYHKSRNTAIYIIGVFTFFALIAYILVQFLGLDYVTSPFISGYRPDPFSINGKTAILEPFAYEYVGKLFMVGYVLHAIIAGCVYFMALIRLTCLYKPNTIYFKVLFICAIVAYFFKFVAISIGALMSWRMIHEHQLFGYFRPTPFDSLQNLFFAIDNTAAACFFFSTSFMFLMGIGKGLGIYSREFLWLVFFEKEGLRFVVIALINIFISAFCTFGAVNNGQHTHVTQTYLFMSTLAYCTEFHTFLQTSYVSVKEIVNQAVVSSGSGKSLKLAKPSIFVLGTKQEGV